MTEGRDLPVSAEASTKTIPGTCKAPERGDSVAVLDALAGAVLGG
jgi:hypothetical protein